MNILKEIVYGKEGLAEREHKKEGLATFETAQTSEFKNTTQANIYGSETTVVKEEHLGGLETKFAQTHLEQEDAETALERVKREEIREGIQTTASVREPVNLVTVPKEAILQEHIHPVEKVEVQPILHRERQQMEVHQIVQPIEAREVLPAVVQEKELPPQFIGDFVESDEASRERYVQGAMKYESTVDVDGLRRIRIIKEPIVEEVIKKTIIEEVQPVIHKETIAPVLIKETLPLYEKVVEAPVIVQEERTHVDMGIKLPDPKSLPLDEATIAKLHSHQEDPNLVRVTTFVQSKDVV
jgi:hypothetical protein